MTYGDIESRARDLVNDRQEPYRFSQEALFGFAVDAVRHLRNINPSEKYGPKGLLDEAIPEREPNNDIRIDPRHEEAVVLYVAYKAYQQDVTDTVNMQIAENLRTRAEALMQL